MMKRMGTRLLSILLALLMCVQILPAPVMAALLDNDDAYNQEILDSLTEIVGSEEEASRYYAMLEHYGLLDEDGNLSQTWEIWMDGEQVTLEEIRAILDEPDCDLEKYVLVDGQAVTLGSIRTMLEIEEYIAYLRETYYDGHEWTVEQQGNLQSLINQIETEGITLTTEAAEDGAVIGASGVSHTAVVSVKQAKSVLTTKGDMATNTAQIFEKALDGNPDTKWYSTAGLSRTTVQTYPVWIQVELPAPISVSKYSIVTGDDAYRRDPAHWQLLGSNNGIDWDIVDEQFDALPETRLTEVFFPLSKQATYRFFRFEVYRRRAANDDLTNGGGLQMTDLQFYAPDGNLIDLNSIYAVELSNAAPGQTVTFDWEALSGSQSVSGSGTVTMTADASGSASTAFGVNKGDVSGLNASAQPVYSVKLSNLTNALFENGRSVASLTDKTTAPISETEMNGVKEAAKGTEYALAGEGPTGGGFQAIFTLTDAQKMALRWGVLNHAALTSYTKGTLTPKNTGPTEPAIVDYTKYELLADGARILYFEQVWNIAKNTTTDTYGTKHNKATIVKRQSGASGRDPDQLTYTKLDTLAESTTFTINGTSRYEKYPIKTIYTQLAPRGITIYSSDNVTTGDGIGDGQTVACTIVFKDAIAPAVTAVSAPAGTYYPGQIVPVLVTFSEPVDAASARIKFNGGSTQYAAAEGSGYSDALTFPYTVPEVDNATLSVSAVTVTDLGGNKLSDHNPGNGDAGQELTGVILSTPVKTNAITGMAAEMGSEDGQITINVTVGITNDEKNTAWMVPEQDENGRLYAKDLTVSLDGKTMYPLYFLGDSFGDGLTASIPVPLAEDTAVDYVVELYLENKLVLGRYGKATQQPPVMITEEDLSATIDLGGYTFEDPDAPIFYVQDDMKALTASIRLSGSGYAFGDTTKTAVDGTEEAEAADFVWKSGDPTVAAVDKDGKITPTGKAGTTQITLTARNGGTAGKAVTVTATYTAGSTQRDTLQFDAGLTPFLSIPNDTVTVLDGSDVTVYWTSNLCDKNGEIPTEFTVVVTRGETEVYRTTVSGTAAAPAGSVRLPHEKLTYDYTAAANTYTVTVSAQYEGSTYSDTATVTLEAQPAQVALGQLNTYYILDTSGTIPVPWSVTHLDSAGSANQNDIFRFRITRNDTEIATNVALSLSSDGSAGGVFHLPIHPISASTNDPTSYREIYTVTLQAKNGIHSTWSYDSFMLYVYDADALKIMVDGTAKTGTTMSNVSAISQMSQAQILALNRDIYLKNIISANYGEYAWTEVADQIAWKSSDSGIASVNYQQGTLYDNIEDFSYVSYRPTAEFGLSGLRDGSVTVTATHRLTGMAENLNVTVETLKDKLYLFQCYPQAVTTLRYQDSTGAWKTATSDSTGAAAIYEENGIHSNVYCSASINNIGYLGTFYLSDLKTGEGDWTRLERYPCNNLTLRRAAYAYLYLKNPDGTPYTGSINFRGGVYINGTYIPEARFGFSGTSVSNLGYENTSVSLNSSGKLEIHMDQTQWPGGMISAEDDVQYVFEISQLDSLTYYPLIQTVNANVNMDAYVSSGSATVAFRGNAVKEKVPFVAVQRTEFPGGGTANVLDSTGNIGPSDTSPEVALRTQVMWWDGSAADNASIRFTTESGKVLSEEKDFHTLKNNVYPFTSVPVTELVVDMNEVSLDNSSVGSGVGSALNLEYYADGKQLSRRDTMSFRLLNLIGVGPVYEAESLTDMLTTMGKASDSSEKETMGTVDRFVNIAMDLVSNDDYTPGTNFALELAPTNDPSKFLGLIKVNIGNIRDANQVTGIYAPSSNPGDFDVDYMPGLNEFMVWKGKRSIYSYLGDDLNRVMKRETVRNIKGQLGGYAESLIYFDENSGKWEIQILNGGFNMGAGVTYAKHWNMQAGPVPVTISLTFGGTAEVSMDAMSVAYYNATKDETRLGNDFLTQLRVYLFLHFFAGVGIDYAVVAFKLGIFGQISLDMQFQWLNRPYMNQEGDIYNVADETYNDSVAKVETEFQERPTGEIIQVTTTTWSSPNSKLDGQRFKIDGQIGLQLVIRFLFFNFEQILYSYSFNLMDETTGDWDTIQTNWTKNKEAQYSAISSLLGKKALTVTNMGGQQMFSLNLAPTVESRDYLAEGSAWKSNVGLSAWEDGNGPEALHYNTYPYANPVITGDGQLLAYLADQGSENVEDTRAFFTVHNGSSFREGTAIDDGEGYGDSQIALSGNGQFAAAAWTRQMESIQKDAGAVLTTEDQLIMMNSAEIYAAVYNGTDWATVRLTDNSTADLAPVVAANGSRAIVAWRSVASSGAQTGDYAEMTNFDEKDTILYRIYDGTQWSQTQTLYNGTSGAVKGLTAAMLADGTAAVAYSLDPDSDDATIADREIWYAVVDNSGEVSRNVRATNDADLDENPQLTAVTFPGADNEERFVLGWYAEHSADGGEPIADIRLLDFNSSGRYTQLLPDSVNQAAYTASITPTFRFAKNASSINDLSILWAERNEDLEREAEKDVLKAVKFYTYGQNRELIRFTGVIDVGEMGNGTVIDHFDAYVSDSANNEIQAVILGTTYGADGVVSKIGTTISGDTVQYDVPSRTTSMYMAAATYGNTIEVTNLIADYETIRKGAKSEILFTIENKGIDAVKSLTINLTGGRTTTYSDLNLLPGTSIQLYADYVVPTDRVVNPDYTIRAVFNQGETHAVGDKIYLNIPDLAITDASIIREENGERTILVKLNNGTDADLAGSGRTVNIGFYSDATCETPIEGLKPISVTSAADLAMIDEGGYSVSAVFDVNAHLKDEEITEIPDSGIQIFIKAEVLEEDEVVPELIESNNEESVVCENLKTRTGSDAIITSTLSNNDDGTTVSVRIQNTRLSEAATGNVIVTLLDQGGNVVGQQQSFDPKAENNGLLTLGGEEKATVTFTFVGEAAKRAASVDVAYSDDVPQAVTPEIVGVEESYLWTGKPIRPAVSILVNGSELSADDYEVIYGSNTDAGTGSVTVVLKGNYSGEATATFTIRALSPYDVNKDGIVNLLDMTRAQRFYGMDDLNADVNADGEVNIDDLVLILNNFDAPFA